MIRTCWFELDYAMAGDTGDPTWDYVDAPMMAILTFFSHHG